jgi:hypothetical protein
VLAFFVCGIGRASVADVDEPAPVPDEESAGTVAPKDALPTLSEQELKIGLTFQSLADEFGFTEYVQASRTSSGRGLLFQYLPEGEELDRWTYLGGLVLTRVGETWEQGAEALPEFFENFRKRLKHVNDAVTWSFPEGDVAFVDYEFGGESLRVHNLAVMWQVFPGHLAIFQAQRRPERFQQWQITHFREVAQRLGRVDRP